MKLFLVFIFLAAVQTASRADYTGWDLRLPRLRGVRKILVKETHWDDGAGRLKIPRITRSVLWLNKDGLVVREDDYEQYSWRTGYTLYEYNGNDTDIARSRIFSYRKMRIGNKRPKKDSIAEILEIVDGHSDPLRKESADFRIDTLGVKHLERRALTVYDSGHRELYFVYRDFESSPSMDSTIYRYIGDTQISMTYTHQYHGSEWQPYPFMLTRQETNVIRRDSLGRVTRWARIAHTYSGMHRNSDFLYDKKGRYLGERYEQECERCKTGWQKGADRRSYDAQSRLKSISYSLDGKLTAQIDLEYVQ